MNSLRKTTGLLAALALSMASLPAVASSPARAESMPAPTAAAEATPTPTIDGATTTTEPAISTEPSPSTEPSTQLEQSSIRVYESSLQTEEGGDHPITEHTFETPLPTGNKGVTAKKTTTEAYSLARAGDIKVRLAMVQLADKKATISETEARASIKTSSDYWQAMSNGRLSMSVASIEHKNSTATSTMGYAAMMDRIAWELGWSPSPYTALVVFVSTPTLSDGAYGAGWSYNGTSGRVLMPLPGTLTKSVVTHEFGHVLGLMHANSLVCTDGAQDTATNADGSFANKNCSIAEYKDTLDVMGASQPSQPVISSPSYEFGGFGAGKEVYNAGKAVGKNSYQLKAWSGADNYRAVKFTDPVSGEIYYLELRLPVGYDAGSAVTNSYKTNSGVKIVQSMGAGSVALPPNTRPFDGYYGNNQAWQAGQTFRTHAGTRVTIDWISGSAAGVTVEALPLTKAALIHAGDFNSDGRSDLIQRRTNGELWFHSGDGTGKFSGGQKIGSGWHIFDRIFGVGDFDKDGKNDLVARKPDGSLWFYAGTGTVSSTNEGYRPGVKIGEWGWDAFDSLLGVRDFDGDGHVDILARRPDGVLFLYPGNGTGKPGTPRQIDYGWQIFNQLIAIADFNGDGTNDLAGRKPDGTLWLYANSGKATLVKPQQIGTGWNIYDEIVGTGDVNGDRTADFVARHTDGTVYLYAGTAMRDEGYGPARKIGEYGWEVFNSLTATGDLNGDAFSDLVARKPDGTLWFYPGNGAGAYGGARKIGEHGWEVFDALVGVRDFNGDGKNDLLARKPDGSLWFYAGTGRVDSTSAGFSGAKKIGDFGWEVFTALTGTGDLNGDGKNDLVARRADGSLWLYPGTGTVSTTSDGYARAVKIGEYGWEAFDQLFGPGDYNADGRNDLIARGLDGSIWMYPGDGTGKLTTPRRIGTGWNVFNSVLGAGHLNGDSFPDLVARRPDGSLWAYSGTGMQPNEGYLPRTFAART